MLKSGHEPRLAIELITSLRDAAGVPLILHGGSGITDTDFVSAIEAGVSMVHINTEIRVIFRDALKLYLQDNPDEISPYKIMAPAMHAMEKRIRERLQLFRMGHI
jgi:fructose-bisphosphate aldolase class II